LWLLIWFGHNIKASFFISHRCLVLKCLKASCVVA
jgi:hypothetical protein